MQAEIFQNSLFRKNIFKHGLVLVTFLLLTVVVTFPVILDFGTEAIGQGCYDKCHMMWRMWWADFSFENNLDFYKNQYVFHPEGTTISGNLAQFTTGIGAVLQNLFGATLAWNILWMSGFVFGGYSAFLLAEYLTKNPFASIIAGIIFTFSTYHLVHSHFHIGLSMIVWLPLFILILFKILNKNSKILIGLGSLFLFLTAITHLYFLIFSIMFSIIFFVVFIFQKKNISNKNFIRNFSLILGIGLIAVVMMFSPILFLEDHYEKRTLDEHIKYSGSLVGFFMPTFFHSSQINTDYWLMNEIFNIFGEDPQFSSIEGFSYLGYPVILLSIIAIIKFRRQHTWFWAFVGIISAIISLGPELKMINNLTGILMPERLLFDYIPQWEEFRSVGRFIIITHLSMAILSAFAINGIMQNQKIPKKILFLIVIFISIIIIFDVSSPFSTHTQSVPKIYEEIKNDKSNFVILESPIGGINSGQYTSHPTYNYYQIFHEKPIIGGFESRSSIDSLKQSDNYYFKEFQFLNYDNNDIIKQDLRIHGASILNYFDVKYVIIHKNEPMSMMDLNTKHISIEGNVVKKINNLMLEILNEKLPYYEDENVIGFKIPKSDSQKPFLLLGKGWERFEPSYNSRGVYPEANIKIINPTDDETKFSLKIKLMGFKESRNIEIFFNGKYFLDATITPKTTTLELKNLQLMSGENSVSIRSDGYDIWLDKNFDKNVEISLIGFEISEIKN